MRTRRAGRTVAVAALFAATGAPPAAAQPPDTLVLSLERALGIARLGNPTYRQAVNALGLNAPERNAAWADDILPSLRLNVLSTGYEGRLTRRSVDFFGNPIANPDAAYVYTSDTQQGLSLRWQIRGPSLWNRRERLDATNGDRTLAQAVAGEALRVELHRAFFDALEQEALLAAERSTADSWRSDLEAVQRRFELALRTRVDVLEAELQIEQQGLAVRRQEGRRDHARLALRAVLGDPGLPPLRPAETPPPLFDPAGLDEEALVTRATTASAPVRQADAALRSAEVGVHEGRARYWPTLSATFDVGRFVQDQDSRSLFRLGGFGGEMFSRFAVRLSLPFFDDVLGNRLAIARAAVERDNADEALRRARIEAERAARSALGALREAWEVVRIADRSVAIAGEALELAREQYRLGGGTFEQLQRSIRAGADARRQRIEARYRFVDALLALEAAVGGPVARPVPAAG